MFIATTCFKRFNQHKILPTMLLEIMIIATCVVERVYPQYVSRNSKISNSEVSTCTHCNCPPWYVLESGECSYSNQLPQILNQYEKTAELQLGYCMTVTHYGQVVSRCPYIQQTYNSSEMHSIYRILPDDLDEVNETLCFQFNRKGFLCSECQDGYGLAVYQYYGLMCVTCGSGAWWRWFVYLLLELIPSTLFFLIMIIFRFNINSGSLTVFVFISNIIISTTYFYPSLIMLPQLHLGKWSVNIVLALYAFWSLEFLRFLVPPFCLSDSINSLQLVSLGYVSALYPLFLCLVTYCLIELHGMNVKYIVIIWKPFHKLLVKVRKPWKIQTSVVHTFATFLLLSYAKIIFVTFTVLQSYKPVILDTTNNKVFSSSARSIDLVEPYFKKAHAPYAVLALFTCIVLIVLPLIIILLYPTRLFQKIAPGCGPRKLHAVRTFVEVYQGCYKDGTTDGGSRDYRLVSGIYLIGRICIAAGTAKQSSTSSITQHYDWLITSAFFVVTSIFFAIFKPYRQWCHNVIDAVALLWIAKMCICIHVILEMSISEQDLNIMVVILILDLAAPYLLLLLWIGYKLSQFIWKLMNKVLKRNMNMLILHVVDDEIEENRNLI